MIGIFKKEIFGYVREESKKMYNLCCKRANSIGKSEYIKTDGRIDFEAIYKEDMKKFLVYIACSDGKLSKEEAKFISELTGENQTEFDLREYAESYDLYSEHIKDSRPLSLEPFIRNDAGPETGEISFEYYDLVTLYVTTFNYIGNDLIACNDDISKGEVDALSSYIMMLRTEIESIKEKVENHVPSIKFARGSKVNIGDSMFGEIEEKVYNYTGNGNLTDERRKRDISEAVSKTEQQHRDFEVGNGRREATVNGYNEDISNREQDEQAKEEETDFIGKVVKSEENTSLEELLEELNSLTGMESVKKEVNNLVNLMKICRIRQEKGLKLPPTTNHLVFLGNPGTGKTTVARILAKIYHSIGVLSKGQLVEVDRSGLVAGYMGQTGIKVMEVVERAKGGVLFIDEAYALSANKSEGDFGQEAIDILNKAMEDYKDDLIVIAAGYHDEMQTFLDANPGLRSRFNRTIKFPNYSADDLIEIMSNRAKKLDYIITDDALKYISDTFTRVLEFPPENFGNARSARNYLDNVINNQANRIVNAEELDENTLKTLTIDDVRNVELC